MAKIYSYHPERNRRIVVLKGGVLFMKGGDQGFESGASSASFNAQRQNTEGVHPDWHSSMRADHMVPTRGDYPVHKGAKSPEHLMRAVLSAGTQSG